MQAPSSAIETPFGALIERAFSTSSASPPPQHFVHLLETGDDALLARIHLIRAAKQTIDIQTFIWSNDDTGRYVIRELVRAAERGVAVRLIVDQWVASLAEDVTPELVASVATAHPNLTVKSYNPGPRFNPPKQEMAERAIKDFKALNQRMHNKLFVVDGVAGIAGGRNVENDYYDRGERRNYRDRDALVIGPVVGDMRKSFEDYWSYERCLAVDSLPDVAGLIARDQVAPLASLQGFDADDSFDDLDSRASDPRETERRFIQRAFSAPKVRFVADEPGKNPSAGLAGGGRTTDALRALVVKAETTLVMQSPYLVFDANAEEALKQLRTRRPGIDILISTNSLASTDNLMAYSYAHKQRKKIVRDFKLRIFELKPLPGDMAVLLPRHPILAKRLVEKQRRGDAPQPSEDNKFESAEVHMSLHAKTYVVDQRAAWIGSFNLDPRSENLNTETALIVEDAEVARTVEASISRDIAPQNSWTIARREKPPIRNRFSGPIGAILERSRSLGFWPFEYTESFELKEGRPPVPCFDREFYRNYRPIGPFPGVSQPVKDVEMNLLQAFGSIVEPIL
jgi:phosphatidylserine/phosphatidylglycerophosphate/cardiolipin synthase-like enzyme